MQILIIGILVVVGAGVMWFMNTDKQAAVTTNTPTPIVQEVTPTPTTDTAPSTSAYKDGTYSTVAVYSSPAGDEAIDVSLTLADGVVTDATFVGKATNPASVNNQEKFAKGFKAKVVGKSLEDIKLSVVNGASLTTKGFMDAVDTIKQDARQG